MPKHATKTSFKTKHGGWTQHRGTYQSWQDMKNRCYNPRAQQYKNYGARGIFVCERWLQSFANFLTDMGDRPEGLTLDRKDNDAGYSHENCRWASRAEQRRNQRDNVILEYNGEKMTVQEWARKIGRHPATVRARIKMGYPLHMILEPGLLLRGNVSPLAALKESR